MIIIMSYREERQRHEQLLRSKMWLEMRKSWDTEQPLHTVMVEKTLRKIGKDQNEQRMSSGSPKWKSLCYEEVQLG